MALSTLTSVKTTGGISLADTSQDTALTAALAAAGTAVKSYTKRWLESKSYTWYLSGLGRQELVLPERPVTAIAGVWLDPEGYFGRRDGAFASDTELTDGEDYVLQWDEPQGSASRSGLLLRIGGGVTSAVCYPFTQSGEPGSTLSARLLPSWPRGFGNIKVQATAGYTSIPEDLARACDLLSLWLWQTGPDAGIVPQSESYEEYSVSRALTALYTPQLAPEIGTIAGLLSRYREIVLR